MNHPDLLIERLTQERDEVRAALAAAEQAARAANERARLFDEICFVLRDAGLLQPAGQDWPHVMAVIKRVVKVGSAQGDELDKLSAFKSYVHHRLDEAGVPADPDSPHKAEGCRIGGRLDVVLGEPRWIPVREKEVPSDIPVLTYRGNAWPPYMTIGSGGTSGGCSGAYVVTHWMPLPPSPVAGGPGGAERSER